MGSVRQLILATALCCASVFAEPQAALLQPVPGRKAATPHLEQLETAAHHFAATLKQAEATLAAVQDKASAQAAVPAVLAVQDAEASLKTAIGNVLSSGLSADELMLKAKFGKHLRRMPIEAYNQQLRRIQEAACYDCAELYLVFTGRSGEFTPEQLNATLSEEDAATLRELETLLSELPDLRKNLPSLLARADALQARVDKLQQSPAAAMRWQQILLRQEKNTGTFFSTGNFGSGEFEDRCFLKANTFLSSLCSEDCHRLYFSRRGMQHTNAPAAQAARDKMRAAYAEALQATRKKYKAYGGDGLTPDTAIRLPKARLNNYEELINAFSREVFGEASIYSDPENFTKKDKRGRTIVRALACVGRCQLDANDAEAPVILLEIYFIQPRN